jgi:phosphoenolpyruvate carboxykinase (ATP)
VGEVRETAPDGAKTLKRSTKRVQIPEIASIIKGIVTESIEWEEDGCFKTKIPKRVPGMDIGNYNPRNFYSDLEIEEMVKDLKNERREYLLQFENLDPKIKKSV